MEGMAIKITAYRRYADCDVVFEDGTVLTHQPFDKILSGRIRYPKSEHEISDRIEEIHSAGTCGKIRTGHRLGEVHMASNGMEMTIVKYRNSVDCDVRFEDGVLVQHRAYDQVQKGKIQHSLLSRKRFDREGQEFMTYGGHKAKIIEYRDRHDCDIQFEDGTIVRRLRYTEIAAGQVRHPVLDRSKRWKGDSRIGEVYHAADNNMPFKIIKYDNCNSIDIEFEDGKIMRNLQYFYIKAGKVKYTRKSMDPYPVNR